MLCLTACQAEVSYPHYSPVRFADLRPVVFDVDSITLVEEYSSPMASPNVEHRFPVNITEAVKIWINDRLKASGNTGKIMKIVLKDASVIEQELPKDSGFKSMFTNAQSGLYKANLEVVFEVYDNSTNASLLRNTMYLHVNVDRTIDESASVDEREKLFYEIMKELIASLNKEFEKNVSSYLGRILHSE